MKQTLSRRPWHRRCFFDPLEALLVFLALGAIRLIPVDLASGLGGWLGRRIGPRLPVTERARINLRLAFPGIAPVEEDRIVRGMWDNLGRMLLEYPHLGTVTKRFKGRIETVNPAPLRAIVENPRPAIFCAAHLANFEIPPLYASRFGILLSVFARAPNNPLIAKAVNAVRSVSGVRVLGKSAQGALQAREVLAAKGLLGALVDQKHNRGIPVAFFGHPAMTAVAPAKLALRFKADLLLCRVERLNGARFRLTLEGPLPLPDSGNPEADARQLTETIAARVEAWIRAKPEDWFWLHRRWPKEVYRRDTED